MMKNTVTVFVASSFEVHNARVAIGNRIRQLNDKYEVSGIRVRLNCWEDYKPEYTGERKQDEYNRDLVLTSQILIGLFKTRCGDYTQEEVKLGISNLGRSNVHCFYEIDDKIKSPSREVVNFFCENSIEAMPYDSVEAICAKVTSIVEGYIDANCTKVATPSSCKYVSNLYSTIPVDLHSYEPEVGNIIRQLDSICENNFQLRCRLSPFHTPANIMACDYYITIYDKEFSDDDRYELERANQARTYGRMNALAIYEIPGADCDIKLKLAEWRHFPVRLDHLDVLRFRTLIYLVSHIMNVGFNSLGANNLIELNGNRIMCCNHYIGDFNVLRTLKDGLFTDVINRWNDIHGRLCMLEEDSKGEIFNNPTDEYLQLSQEKKYIELQLKKYFALTVDFLLKETECVIKENQRIREFYDAGKYGKVIEEVDTKAVAEAAVKDISIIGDRKKSVDAKLERIEIKIKSLMSALMSGEQIPDGLNSLYRSFDDMLSVQEGAYEHRIVSEKDIIATLHQYISAIDTWGARTLQQEDVFYKKLVEYADKGGVTTLEVEGVRGNYANSLSRDYKYKEAFAQYEIAIKNILALDDNSRNARKSVSQVFLNYVSCFDEFYDGSHSDVLGRWKRLLEQFAREDDYFNIELINVCTKEILHLPKTSSVEDALVLHLEQMIERMSLRYSLFDEQEQHNMLYDVIVLACHYIDRFEQNNTLCTQKAIVYLDMAKDLYGVYKKQAPLESIIYSSQINHNRGFLLAKNLRITEALLCYQKAYKERTRLCEILGDEETKSNLAETAVNLSDSLLQLGRYDEAIESAKKAVELYSALLQPEYEHTYMNLYKAKQMLGSIYVFLPDRMENGLGLLKECWDWASQHANSTYHKKFKISYNILRQAGRI